MGRLLIYSKLVKNINREKYNSSRQKENASIKSKI
jgi:hypothetical protein